MSDKTNTQKTVQKKLTSEVLDVEKGIQISRADDRAVEVSPKVSQPVSGGLKSRLTKWARSDEEQALQAQASDEGVNVALADLASDQIAPLQQMPPMLLADAGAANQDDSSSATSPVMSNSNSGGGAAAAPGWGTLALAGLGLAAAAAAGGGGKGTPVSSTAAPVLNLHAGISSSQANALTTQSIGGPIPVVDVQGTGTDKVLVSFAVNGVVKLVKEVVPVSAWSAGAQAVNLTLVDLVKIGDGVVDVSAVDNGTGGTSAAVSIKFSLGDVLVTVNSLIDKEVADVATLSSSIAALSTTTSTSMSTTVSTLNSTITALSTQTSNLSALSALESTLSVSTGSTISALSTSLSGSLSTVNSTVSSLITKETADVNALNSSITALSTTTSTSMSTTVSTLNSTITDLSTQTSNLSALSTLQASDATAISVLQSSLAQAIATLNATIVVLDVSTASSLLTTDPLNLLSNFVLSDTKSALFTASSDSTNKALLIKAKFIRLNDGTALSVSDLNALTTALDGLTTTYNSANLTKPVSLSLDYAKSSYSLSDTAPLLTGLSGVKLASAVNINSTGAAATAAQANTLLRAGNSGTTTLSGVTGTATQILALPVAVNTVISNITVTGTVNLAQTQDIANLATLAATATWTVASLTDTASTLVANSAGLLTHAVAFTATTAATAAQAAVLAAMSNVTAGSSYSVSDSSAALTSQISSGGYGFIDSASAVSITSGTVDVVTLIAWRGHNANLTLANLTDTATAIDAALTNSSTFLSGVTYVHVTGPTTTAQAVNIEAHASSYLIDQLTGTSAGIYTALAAHSSLLTGVTAVTIADTTTATDYVGASGAAVLAAASLPIAFNVYDTGGGYSAAITASGTGFLNEASNINLHGATNSTIAQTLMSAANSGTTAIETINASVLQASKLAFGSNDVVTNLAVFATVSPITGGTAGVADLTNVPFGVNVTYNGQNAVYAQTVLAPLPDAKNLVSGVDIAGKLVITGGSGADTYVLSDDMSTGTYDADGTFVANFIPTTYAVNSALTTGGGADTLVVIGTVDISNIALDTTGGTLTLRALPGSPSEVKMTAAQLLKFTTIAGSTAVSNPTKITIVDSTGTGAVASVDLTQQGAPTLTNVSAIYVGVNTNVVVSVGSLSVLGSVTTGTATQAGDSNGKVTPVIPPTLNAVLDLSAINYSLDLTTMTSLKVDLATGQLVDDNSGFHVILPSLRDGQNITLKASQLQSWSRSTGTTYFTVAKDTASSTGKLVISADADPTTINLSNVVPGKILSLGQNTDLSSGHSFVQALAEIQLNGHNLTVDVSDISGAKIGGNGNITVTGTTASLVNLSQMVVTSGNTIDLTGLTGPVTLPATVNAGMTLKLTDAQFVGSTQQIANSGTIKVFAAGIGSLVFPAAPDFSGITGQGTKVYDIDHDTVLGSAANLNGVSVLIESTKTLTIDANAGSGLTFNGPSGAPAGRLVVIGTLTQNADFSHLGSQLLSADLSGVALAGKTLTLASAVGAGQTLILSETQANGATIAASGTLNIAQTASVTNGALDLSHITVTGAGVAQLTVSTDSSYTSFKSGVVAVSVNQSKTLTISVNDAGGETISGTGSVILTGVQTDTSTPIGLNTITAGLVTWEVAANTTFVGNLGSTVVTVDHGKTLTLDAATASGKTFDNDNAGLGLGSVKLTGTYDALTNLSHVATNIDLTSATVSGLVGFLPAFASNQALTLTYEQADNIMASSQTVDVGVGTAVIVSINSKDSADLSAISATGSGGKVIAEVANNKTFTGNFGTAQVKLLTTGVTLTVAATKISARTVYALTPGGTGGMLLLTGDGGTALTGNVNLGNITTNFDVTAITGLAVDATSHTLSNGTYAITTGTLVSGQNMWVSAAQLGGVALALAGNSGSTLNVTGDLIGNVTLASVADAVAVSFKDTASDSAPTINIGTNTLTAKASQLSGKIITSDAGMTGLVVVVDNASFTLGGNIDLSRVAADMDLTSLQGLSVDATTHRFADSSGNINLGNLRAYQNIKVNTDQLAGALSLSGDANSSLQVVGNFSVNTNLTNVADAIAVNFNNTTLQISGATLTAKALQVSGLQITSATANSLNTGTLALTDNSNGTGSLSTLTNLTQVGANIDLTQLLGVSVNNAADLGYLTDGQGLVLLPTLTSAQSLTITAAQAHGGTFDSGAGVMRNAGLKLEGSGTLVLSGNLTAGNVDLTGLPTSIAVSINGTNVVGADLVLTAAQANTNIITSDATGRVVIQGVAVTPALSVADLHTSLQTATLPVTSSVTDTAAHLSAAVLTDLQQILPSYGTVTVSDAATVAQATTFANWHALGSNPVNVVYAIRDTASSLAAATDAVLALGNRVSASTSANIAQAIAIDALTTLVSYSITDTAAAVAAAVSAAGNSSTIVNDALAGASSIALTGAVSFADAAVLSGLTSVKNYAISDTAEHLSSLLAANSGSTAFLSKVSALTITGSLNTADANTLLSSASLPAGLPIWVAQIADTRTLFEATYGIADNLPNGVLGLAITGGVTVATAPASGAVTVLSDTATNVVNAGVSLLARVTGIVTISDYANVAQAQTLAYRSINNNVNGVNIVYSVKDSSANIAGLLYGSYENLPHFMHGSFYTSDVANAVNGAKIALLATRYAADTAVKFNFSVSDSAANILANFNAALLNKVTGTVDITGTVTAAQAIQILNTFSGSKQPSYSISDTAANIYSAFNGSGAAFLNKAINITVTDTVNYAQAYAITHSITNSGTTSFAAMSDTVTNIGNATSEGLLGKVSGAITATATATDDLSHITANLDLTGTTGLGTNGSGLVQMSAVSSQGNGVTTVTTYTVSLPATLANNRTLSLTSAHVAGATGITIGGSGTVNIANDITRNTDLRGLGGSVNLRFMNSGESGVNGTAAVTAGVILQLMDDQAHAQSLTGLGTVQIHGRTSSNGLEVLTGNANISDISANIDLTALDLTINSSGILSDAYGALLSSGTNGTLVLQNGQTLSLTQTELFGSHQLVVNGTGVIDVRGNITSDLDLRYLANSSGVTLSFYDPSEAGTYGTVDVSGTAQTPITLTLTATQASNQMITGSNSTIFIPYNSVAGTNLSASTNLAQVASTLWKSNSVIQSAITTRTGGWTTSSSVAGTAVASLNASGQLVLSNTSNSTNNDTYFTFTAASAGIYSFAYTFASNNFSTGSTTVAYSTLNNAAISGPQAWAGGYHYDYFSVQTNWGNSNNGWVYGGNTVSGTLTASLAAGQYMQVRIYNGLDKTVGDTGWQSAPSTLTITSTNYSGGFSAVGGTSQTLNVEVGTSTDVSSGGLLNLVPVDQFILKNSGTVLTMTPMQASSHVITTSDGYGSVLLTGTSTTFVDLTKIAVPLRFTSDTLNISNSWTFLTPEQANGAYISGGNFYLVGGITAGERIDLTRVSAGINYTTTVSSQNTNSIALGAGSSLILTPGQVSGRTVSNAIATPGTVYVVGDLGSGGSVDLRNVTSNLSFYDGVTNTVTTPNGSLLTQGLLVTRTTTETSPLGLINMGGNAYMYINGYQLAGQTVTGNGSNQIYVYSNVASGADYSHITASIDLTNATVVRTNDALAGFYDLSITFPASWNADQVLTLTGAQANALVFDNHPAQVLVRFVEGLMDGNGNITADFTHINAAHPETVTLEFGGGYAVYSFSGSFGGNQVLIGSWVQLKMTGAQADNVVFDSRNNLGAIGITGITANTDLTKTINTPTITFPGVIGKVNIDLSYAVTGGASLNGNAVGWVWSSASAGSFQDANGHTITLPTFNGNDLIVDASQLSVAYNGSGGPLVAPALSGSGRLVIKAQTAFTQSLDLTSLSSNFSVRLGTVVTGANSYNDVYMFDRYGSTWFYPVVAAGQTITMRANQTYGSDYGWQQMQLSGAGTLLVTTGFNAAHVYLYGVTANIDLRQLTGTSAQVHLNGNYISYNNTYNVAMDRLASGQNLYVKSFQVAGTGGITLQFTGNADLNPHAVLHIDGDVSAGYYSGNLNLLSVRYGVDVAFNNNTVALASGNTLSMRLDQASNFAVTGAGGTVAFGITSGDADAMIKVATSVDLSAYRASLNFTALSNRGLVLNQSGQWSVGSKFVVLPALISGQTVSATSTEMGGALVLTKNSTNGGGTLNIQGNLTSGMTAIDLTSVDDGIAIDFADAVDGYSGVMQILSNTLTVKPSQMAGQVVTSNGSGAKTGNLVLKGGALAAGGTDLSNVGANIDLTQLSGLSVDATSHKLVDGTGSLNTFVTQTGQTVMVLSSQIKGGALTMNADVTGGGTLDIKGDITVSSSSVDLSRIADGMTVSFADSTSNNIEVSNGNTLTIKAVHARGQTITAGGIDATHRNTGTVIVVDNATGNLATTSPAVTTINLQSITADLNLMQLANLSYSSASFRDGAGTLTLPSLAAYQTLWMSALQLSGTPTIAGSQGAILNVVTNFSGTPVSLVFATDLRGISNNITVSYVTDAGSTVGASLRLGSTTLTMRADQLDNNTVVPAQGSTGTVVVAPGASDTAALRSSVSFSTLTTNLDLTQLAHVGTNYLKVNGSNQLAEGSNLITLPSLNNGQTLTVTAAEMEGRLLLTGVSGTLDIQGNISASVDLTLIDSAIGISFVESGESGTGSISVATGNSLTATAAQVTGKSIAGAGTLTVTGTVPQSTNFSNISIRNIDLTSITGGGSAVVGLLGSMTLQANQSVWVTASGLSGAGTVTLAGAATSGLNLKGDISSGSVDLSQVADTVSVTLADALGDTTPAIVVAGSLTLKAVHANGQTITAGGTTIASRNTGTVVVVNNSTGNLSATSPVVTAIDLHLITADLNLIQLANLNYSNSSFRDAAGTLTLPSLAAYQTLWLSVAQLSGTPLIVGDAGAALNIVDKIGSTVVTLSAATDLSSIDANIALSFVDDSGTPTALQLAGTNTLTLRADQLHGKGVVNASGALGAVVVKTASGAAILGGDVSFTGVTTNLDLTQLENAGTQYLTVNGSGKFSNGTFTVTLSPLASGQTLKVTAAEMQGQLSLSGVSGSTLNIQGDIANGNLVDLTHVSSGIAVSFADSVDSSPQVAVNGTLTAKAAQVSAQTLTGTGSLVVSGTSFADFDLSQIAVSTINLTGYEGTDFTVSTADTLGRDLASHSLLLNDVQATGHVFSAASAAGSLTVYATDLTQSYDFAGIATTGQLNATFVIGTGLASYDMTSTTTSLTGFDSIALNTGTDVLHAKASQLNGVSSFSGVGALYVTDTTAHTSGSYTLYDTANNDMFVGGGYNDVLNLTHGGQDTVKFSGTGQDFVVNGFVADSALLSGDVLDFLSLASLSAAHHSSSSGIQSGGLVSLGTVSGGLNQAVLAITDSTASTAISVETLFGVANNMLNSALYTGLEPNHNHDAIILTANSNPNASNNTAAVNWTIWHWVDAVPAGHDGVQASELTSLGILNGLTKTDISHLTNNNFLV